jgi:hypothetical protein
MAPLEFHLIILERIEEHRRVMDLAHRVLVVVHPVQVIARMLGQEGIDHLDHVAKLLEGNAHPVNGVGLSSIQSAEAGECLDVLRIHCLQDLLHECFVI